MSILGLQNALGYDRVFSPSGCPPVPPKSPNSGSSERTPGRTLLTIAGHDPSSGAGITADLQTFAAHRLFGTSAITALTVQSTLGVTELQAVDPAFLRRALDHLVADLPPSGIKIGMLGSSEIAASVAGFLASLHHAEGNSPTGNQPPSKIPIVPPIVLTPSSAPPPAPNSSHPTPSTSSTSNFSPLSPGSHPTGPSSPPSPLNPSPPSPKPKPPPTN